jgi:inositol-phosphate transport system permease protein
MKNRKNRPQGLSLKERRQERFAIAVMILFCIPIVLVYIVFLSNAFVDREGRLTLSNFRFISESIRLSQYDVPSMGPAFRNSVLFTLVVTVMEVSISCLAGYAIARMEFKGKRLITFSLFALRLFPGVLLLIGMLYVLMYMKIVNTLLGVILAAIALRLPGSTFIIRNFFIDVPRDIENSALVDGCTRLTAFFQVVIHLVKPGIASISLFAFMSAWSNYLLFNTLIFTSRTPVLATYIRVLSRNDQMIADYGVFSAMAIIYMLPVLFFFFISQKQLMQGNIGGGKGL